MTKKNGVKLLNHIILTYKLNFVHGLIHSNCTIKWATRHEKGLPLIINSRKKKNLEIWIRDRKEEKKPLTTCCLKVFLTIKLST